jgi:hypothetical protein
VSANYKIGEIELQDINQGYVFPFIKAMDFCKKSSQN